MGLPTTPTGKQILNTYAVDPNYRVGYAQTWSTSVQNQFKHGFVVELGYLGTKGTRLDIQGFPIAPLPARRSRPSSGGSSVTPWLHL